MKIKIIPFCVPYSYTGENIVPILLVLGGLPSGQSATIRLRPRVTGNNKTSLLHEKLENFKGTIYFGIRKIFTCAKFYCFKNRMYLLSEAVAELLRVTMYIQCYKSNECLEIVLIKNQAFY